MSDGGYWLCDNWDRAGGYGVVSQRVEGSGRLDSAWRALGERLARYRRAAGLSQSQLAGLVEYSRSTIGNVETGRQHVPADFWRRADEAVGADRVLLTASEEIEAVARGERLAAAHDARPLLLVLGENVAADVVSDADETAVSAGAVGSGVRLVDMVAAAASQARDHAQEMAVTGIGPGTVEQLTAEVTRLSRAYVSGPPAPLFAALGQVLGRIRSALDQRMYPAQARDLTFLAGAVCGLMANASLDLGREDAADDLGMAAWTYGQVIDYGPLMGWARGTQALAAIWDERYSDAAEHARNGLTHTPHGMAAARLHAIQARALAAAGERPQARLALQAAGAAYEEAAGDDLHHGIGGEFAFGDAKLWYYRALTLADVGDVRQAANAAETAIRLYDKAPERLRSYGCQALARVELARAHLSGNKLDDAAQALAELLRLEPEMRISSLRDHLQAFQAMLRGPASRGSRTARQLEQQLAAFTAAHAARALPGG